MKIAVRHMMLGTCILGLGSFANPIALSAQSTPQATIVAAATPVSPSGAANTQMQEIKIPDLPTPSSVEGKASKAEDSPAGGKVPDSVKDVIKRLNTRTEDVTLDDLNNAREAVAKLDALIDIEKRLVDLDKIRQEREKANRLTQIAAVPMKDLAPPPPPPFASTPISNAPSPKPFMAPSATVDVLQIEGSNNHYVALIKDGDTIHSVRAGDHLSDDSVVLSVSKRGVELQRSNKTARLIEVKDVQSVFGNSP